MIDKIFEWSGFRMFTGSLLLLMLFAMFIISPLSAIGGALVKNMPKDVVLLDFKASGYTMTEAYKTLGALGAAGRHDYLRNLLTMDILFPLLYAFTFAILIAYLLKKIETDNKNYKWLILLPVFAGLFDLLENASIVTMILFYPRKLLSMAALANVFTLGKNLLFSLILYVVIVELIWLVFVHGIRFVRSK